MCNENEPMRATTGGRCVVVTRDEPGDGLGELRSECRALGGRTKAHFRVEAESREMLALLFGAAQQLANLADDTCRQGDQVVRRESIRSAGGIAGGTAERRRGNDVRNGGGDHASLDESSPSALLDRADESVRLERAEV